MSLLVGYHEMFMHHDTGPGHPERPERLAAVLQGIEESGMDDGVVPFSPRAASLNELERVHDAAYIESIEVLCRGRGGALDADTVCGEGSYEAALRAAGAGVDAVERLRRGEAGSAFVLPRPPGHHALRARAMGFCLFNSVAVTAAALVDAGERVLILDWDAHHGNGTESTFYGDSEVLFVSFHQYPFYPGTGAVTDIGVGRGVGRTLNLPFPAGTAGDAYRFAFDEAVVPAVEVFSPTWVLVSCGFDAHRDDPLAQLELSAGDFADLTARAMQLAPPGRRVLFLEGGYDLDALRMCAGATVSSLLGGAFRPERATSGLDDGSASDPTGPRSVVARANAMFEQAGAR